MKLYLWKIKTWDIQTTITDTFLTKLNKTKLADQYFSQLHFLHLWLRLSFSLFSGHKTLTSNGHLIQEMASSGVDVNYPKHVPSVCHYISANFRIEIEITHGALPCSIEVYTYPLSIAI